MRTTQQVAPGVTYTRIVRGEQSKKDFYTVDVAFKADQSSADSVAAQLRSDGYEPIVQEFSERAPDDPQSGPVGYLVRTGAFATQAEANALRDRLAAPLKDRRGQTRRCRRRRTSTRPTSETPKTTIVTVSLRIRLILRRKTSASLR